MSVTPAERHIMEALWSEGSATVEELRLAVAPQGWGEATLRTLINRLQKRRAIRSERAEGRTRYVPLLTRDAYLRSESRGFLDRVFEGRLAPLVAQFAEAGDLDPEDVRRLREILDRLPDA